MASQLLEIFEHRNVAMILTCYQEMIKVVNPDPKLAYVQKHWCELYQDMFRYHKPEEAET